MTPTSTSTYSFSMQVVGIVTILLLLWFALPDVLNAQGLVNCDGIDTKCDFGELIALGQRILNWLVTISVTVGAALLTYAGVVYATAGGNEGQVSKAQGIAWTVVKGFVLVLAAWLIVYTITTGLGVKEGVSFLEKV